MLQQQLTSSLHAGEAPDGDALCAIEVLPRKTLKKKKGIPGGGGARVTDGSQAPKSNLNNLPGCSEYMYIMYVCIYTNT